MRRSNVVATTQRQVAAEEANEGAGSTLGKRTTGAVKARARTNGGGAFLIGRDSPQRQNHRLPAPDSIHTSAGSHTGTPADPRSRTTVSGSSKTTHARLVVWASAYQRDQLPALDNGLPDPLVATRTRGHEHTSLAKDESSPPVFILTLTLAGVCRAAYYIVKKIGIGERTDGISFPVQCPAFRGTSARHTAPALPLRV
jgi:hypothetical protein